MRTVYPIDAPEIREVQVEAMRNTDPNLQREVQRDLIEEIEESINVENLIDSKHSANTFFGLALTDDQGVKYTSLCFTVQSVSVIGADIWISGNEFRLNYSAYAAGLLEIAEEAFGSLEGRD